MKSMKDCLVEAVSIVRSVEEECSIRFPDVNSSVIKIGLSIYIQANSNGKGNGKTSFSANKGNGKTVLNFGKHKGQTLQEILKDDRSYLRWLSEKAKDNVLRTEAEKLLKEKPAFNKNVIVPEVKN